MAVDGGSLSDLRGKVFGVPHEEVRVQEVQQRRLPQVLCRDRERWLRRPGASRAPSLSLFVWQVGPAGRFLSRSRALALSLPHPLPSLFAAHPDREACVALRPKTSVAGTRSIDRWSITRLAALILDGSERI